MTSFKDGHHPGLLLFALGKEKAALTTILKVEDSKISPHKMSSTVSDSQWHGKGF